MPALMWYTDVFGRSRKSDCKRVLGLARRAGRTRCSLLQRFLRSEGWVVAQKSFPRWRASIHALVRDGGWRWALAVGFAIALGVGVWACDVFGPEISASWPRWKAEAKPWVRETMLWIEFLAGITLTMALVCWLTAFLFSLFCAALFSLPWLLGWFSDCFSLHPQLDRVQHIVNAAVAHTQLMGTLANLFASLGALATLEVILRRSLDYWDIGVQIAISAAIELIVLHVLFTEEWFRKRAHKSL